MRNVLAVFAIVVIGCSGAPTQKPVAGGGSGSAVTGGSASNSSRFPQTSGEINVVVTGTSISMNGTKVSGTPRVTDIIAIYGKPDRTWDSNAANKVHTWDQLGLLVYEPYDGRCISATFPYRQIETMSSAFISRMLFTGSIMLDGNRFDRMLELSTVLSWKGATQPYTPKSTVFDRGDFHVFTIEEQPGTGIDLVELSFWQRSLPGDQEKQ